MKQKKELIRINIVGIEKYRDNIAYKQFKINKIKRIQKSTFPMEIEDTKLTIKHMGVHY